jgi:hypothetical protein
MNQSNFIVHPSADPGPECDHDNESSCADSYDYYEDKSEPQTLYDLIQDYINIVSSGGDPEKEAWSKNTKSIGNDYRSRSYFNSLFDQYLLTPGRFDYLTDTAWFSMRHYLLSHGGIAEQLKRMPYRDFLSSLYWSCVRTKLVKLKHHCQWCESTENLHVHHPKYDFRGEEFLLENYRQLIVLCAKCHADHHGVRG